MIRLEMAGPHTRLCSTLCAECPQGIAGCCAGPPELDWSDLGRVVALGGRDWLLAQIATRNLTPAARGLQIRRVRKREGASAPRLRKCVYHGAQGCTIGPDLRPATCNYFLCDDAFVEGGERRGDPDALAARRAHARLRTAYDRWDRDLAERVAAVFPGGPPWDAAFLDWLGAALEGLASASAAELP